MIEDEKLTAREKRKLRREFSQLGRDSVRYNLQIGAYGVAQTRYSQRLVRVRRFIRRNAVMERIAMHGRNRSPWTCT